MGIEAKAALVIDFEHLSLYTGGDAALTCEVMRLFRTQTADLISLLQKTGDAKTFRETVHALKGASRALGAWEAARAAEAVEQAKESAAQAAAVRLLADALARVHELTVMFEADHGPAV
ncbi:MAG: Hpt domain-containing protein [Alphaproteobacteria bacterium]|nr:Hpt domain-containing protein [Alphaproteobacteria bacterium]